MGDIKYNVTEFGLAGYSPKAGRHTDRPGRANAGTHEAIGSILSGWKRLVSPA